MERRKQDEIERQRQWVLNYFIDPKNVGMDYKNFSQNLLKTAVGDNNSPESRKMVEQMTQLFDELKDARKFNDNYIGHMLSEASIPAMVAHMYATRLGGNTVAPEVSKMETKLEPEAIRFLLDIVGYDKKRASGTFTSGGSMAAFTTLAVARKKIQAKYEVGAKENEIRHIPEPLYVLTTPMVHYCFTKALDFLGGQNRRIQSISVATEGLRMSPKDLERKILKLKEAGKEIMAIYAIAGETETGLVDPLGPIADIAQKYGVFSIADAAYGAPYRWSSKGNLFKDLPRFDAIVIDGHKALYTPYPNGAALFKNADDHVLFGRGIDAPYVQMTDDDEAFKKALLYQIPQSDEERMENAAINYALGKKRPEGSGSAGSILSTVATKRTLGQEGLQTVYEITLDRINYLHHLLTRSASFVPFHNPDVNVLCFTLNKTTEDKLGFSKDEKIRNEQRKALLEEIRHKLNINERGKNIEGSTGYFLSSTDLPTDVIDLEESAKKHKEVRKRHYVLRAVLMNPRTTNAILDDVVARMEQIVKDKIGTNTSR